MMDYPSYTNVTQCTFKFTMTAHCHLWGPLGALLIQSDLQDLKLFSWESLRFKTVFLMLIAHQRPS